MRWGTAAVVAAAVVGTGIAVLALGRKVSDRVVLPGVTARRRRAGDPSGPALVLSVAADRVTFTPTTATLRPGRYAVEWGADGHAVVGDVVHRDENGVTRRLERADHGDRGVLEPGIEVRLTPRVLLGDPATALGLEYTETAAYGELGPMPAWYVPGMRGTWVLLVHGPGTDRQQTLPVLPLLNRLGLPTLSLTYRGDEGAPAAPGGIGRFGDTEWRDVEAAVRLATDSGAGKVVLYGWSLGATMALQTVARSSFADSVSGLIVDSPVLDWPATVRRDATGAGISAPLAELGALAAEGRTGVDLAGFARLADGSDLHVPTLLLHSPDDPVAPWRAAERLAARRHDLVSIQAVPDADHAALWNAYPGRYEEALRRWLTPLL
ncbi:prolyl oligopeptidase family serine peptidase [Kitasatospora sp. NPDC050543]|uniref:prolyl oligopeptidase family serine peptidase n=1 Tax=Kitasatospora sp. NPDC050543 TaxID=3364054 RepID=UPI00378D8C0B